MTRNNQQIRIVLKSWDHDLLDREITDIIIQLRKTGGYLRGPIPLPTSIEKFTVNRSPHIDKKSREQFEIRTHKRVIIITNPTVEVVNFVTKKDLPAGISVQIKSDYMIK